MIKATRNQLGNINNVFQGEAKRVLCVCSAGLLRSPTLAIELGKRGHNTRACGMSVEFALIPITEALTAWADQIVFVDQDARDTFMSDVELMETASNWDAELVTLDIPDEYDRASPELVSDCLKQYDNATRRH